MKKLFFILFVFLIASCTKHDDFLPISPIDNSLKINESVGLKLETPFVNSSAKLNVKVDVGGEYFVKITDISNKVVSKEEIQLKSGDNVVTINTSILPSSAYRLQLTKIDNTFLSVVDFNKL